MVWTASAAIQSQNNLISRAATGLALGAANVSATLDTKPVNVQFDGTAGDGRWRANLDLSPRSHTLLLSAVHPSGLYTAFATNSFTVPTNAVDTVTNQYDGNGNVSKRVWVSAGGQTNRTQTLTWDAFDRLITVSDRDSTNSGFNWTAVYDALGRRLRTTYSMVVSNTPLVSLNPLDVASVVDSWYDPQVEFLETAVAVDGSFTMKTFGPDANGRYGGMQGVGGLETVIQPGQFTSTAVIQDFFGNALASVRNSTVTWSPTRLSAYGPLPSFQSPALSDNVSLVQSLGWRGKRVDETGLISLGARAYDPVAGRFLSADPLGQAASMDLYSFADGDPLNNFDASGRAVIQNWQETQQNMIVRGGFWNNVGAYGISFGITALNAFSIGSFSKNDALVDRNLSGEISDAQLYGGMAINTGVAVTSVAAGAGTGALVSRGLGASSSLLTQVAVGSSSGFAASTTDVAGTRLGYAAAGIQYQQTVGQDLTQIALGTGGGALTGAAQVGLNNLSQPFQTRINLGGEGEVSPVTANVQPSAIGGSTEAAIENAERVAGVSGQPVVMAPGNDLPFPNGYADEVIANNVPMNSGSGYFGPSFTTAETQRILAPGGFVSGSSIPADDFGLSYSFSRWSATSGVLSAGATSGSGVILSKH